MTRKRAREKMNNTNCNSSLLVDVIIPVYKPGNELKELLKRLDKQTRKIHNIIIMHTADGMSLSWIEDKYENVRVYDISPEQFDHGGTRDEGIRHSDADIVVCMTQDAMPADSHLIEFLMTPLESREIVVSYARQLPNKNCDIIERYTRSFNYPEESRIKSKEDIEQLGIKAYFCSNVCAAYEKKIYLELGGFESRTIFNEDMIFASKVMNEDYKIAYAADAKVIHSHNYSCTQQLKRNFDMAVSQAEHPEIFADIKSETEGIRLVKQTAVYLLKVHCPLKIISLILKSGAKYCGYKLGLKYKKMPEWLVKKITMNPRYWGNL